MKAANRILVGMFILFICVNFNTANGQESDSRTTKSDSLYFESPALFSCNLQFPDDYNSKKSLSLVIGLHGGGSSYNSFKNIWNRFESPQFILATPQAPYKWLMGDKIGYDWSAWPTGDLKRMQKAIKLTSDYIENLIKSITDKYDINEVYLMGFSQGSIITQVAGIHNHNLLNGIIILSGPELNHPGKPEIVWPSEETVKCANHLQVCIAHGKLDELVDIEFARKSRAQYEKAGFNVSLFEFEGGHEINAEVMKDIERWINNQK